MLQSPLGADSQGSSPARWSFLRWSPCVSRSAFRHGLDPCGLGVGGGTLAARSCAVFFYSAHLGFQPSSDGSPGFSRLIHSMPATMRVSFQNLNNHSYEKISYYSSTDIGLLLGRELSSHEPAWFPGKNSVKWANLMCSPIKALKSNCAASSARRSSTRTPPSIWKSWLPKRANNPCAAAGFTGRRIFPTYK